MPSLISQISTRKYQRILSQVLSDSYCRMITVSAHRLYTYKKNNKTKQQQEFMATTITVPLDEVKNLLNYNIDNNIRLQEEGKDPIAIGIEAEAGIGKTSIVRQVAEDRGMNIVKLNMAQLEEQGDIIGYPITEYECQILKRVVDKDGNAKVAVMPNTVWVNNKQIEETPGPNMKYRQTGKTRMSYAKPAWVPEYNENGTILLLDDYNRASSTILNAAMEIIKEQKYASWSLPKKTTIVVTNNPDNGSYNVQSMDEAQEGRYVNFITEFSLEPWMKWAEGANIDGRCINFVASYSGELFNSDGEGNRICNPRSFVMFSDMISGINDWDSNLAFITTIAKGCFKDDAGRFAQMFNSFIRNKMHLIVQPKDMLLSGWDKMKGILESTLYDTNGQYRPDIASLLERRFSNYVLAWLSSDGKTPIAKVKDRILDFIENEDKGGKKLFTKDLFFHMLKTITSEKKQQTNHLLYEPKIAKILG